METAHTQLIERYFDELLSPEEIDKVEKLKSLDSNFLQEFELFEKAHKAIKLSTVIDLKSEIRGIHEKMDSPKKINKVIKLRWISIAATILLIIASSFYIQQFSNENLYNEAYEPVDDYVTNMDNDLSEMEKAMDLFNKQQFDDASQLFNKIYTTTGKQVALFYEGHSLYQSGKLDAAIKALSKVSNNYQAEAQWYASLIYLKKGNTTKALEILNLIINDNKDEAFVLRAKKLQEKLRSPFRNLIF